LGSPLSSGSVVEVVLGVVVGVVPGVVVGGGLGVVVGVDPPPEPVCAGGVPGELVPEVVPPEPAVDDPEDPGAAPAEEDPGLVAGLPFDAFAPPLPVPFDEPGPDDGPAPVDAAAPVDEPPAPDAPLVEPCPALSARASRSAAAIWMDARSAADSPANCARRREAKAGTWDWSWEAKALRSWLMVPLADASAGEVTGSPRA